MAAGNFLKTAEQIIQKQKETQLKILIERFAVPLKMFLPVVDVASKVYGEESGKVDEDNAIDFFGVVTSDDFFTSGPSNAGAFIEGYLYTADKRVTVGATIEITRGDGRSRRYKVDEFDSVGQTTIAFSRYKLESLAGEDAP